MDVCETYQEELRQRSRLAACARYRRGLRRRGCRLPSDGLTAAQLQRRNGPVRVFRGGVEVKEESSFSGQAGNSRSCGEEGEV
ncbi:MAG: hypothetical protein IJT94_13435 [Oscillibacter sp.]|nr:hypothetical protein [Oscillibacter sp.]